MARPLRIERVGGWYHVTARGNERREIFRDSKDRKRFLELLGEAVDMFAWRLHAYALMDNHYHLVIELAEANLSRGMHWLNVSYTVWFNRRHGRSGHLFQGRFKSVVVDPEQWGLEISRYVHLNPVRLCCLGQGKAQMQRSRSVGVESVNPKQVQERIKRLRGCAWSSFGAYVGTAKKPAWLTTDAVLKLAGKGRNPAERYRLYCEEAVRQGLKESPLEKVVGQAVLGSERFVARLVKSAKSEAVRSRFGRRARWDDAVRVVERMQGEKWIEFRDRHGDVGRDLVLYLGRRFCGMSIRELAQKSGLEYVSAAAAVRRFSERVQNNGKIAKFVQRAAHQMYNA